MVVFAPNVSFPALTFSAVSLRLLLSLLLLELHVAKVHDGSNYFIAAVLLIRQEAEDVHGMLETENSHLKTLQIYSMC